MDNTALIKWYNANKRDLPWRNTTNPYHIWVSEIMLQQTRVEAVIPYYYRFLEALPTIYSLSEAKQDFLYKLWEGLGYYSRVRNMQSAAIMCVQQYGGSLPTNYKELLQLKGIGPYSAGAIASFAYQERVGAVDGNVLRVYSRFYELYEDITTSASKHIINEKVLKDMPEDVSTFNQALMELGACICIGNGAPRCNICPIQKECSSYRNGKVHLLPVKKKQTARRKEKWSVVIHICDDYVLIRKREQGLLANLYEFQMVEGHLTKSDLKGCKYLGKSKHIFSHIEWDMKGFMLQYDEKIQIEGFMWVAIRQLKDIYPLPTALQKYRNDIYSLLK